MTWKDKLEIGLKDDAPFRRDNLPEFQQTDPETRRKTLKRIGRPKNQAPARRPRASPWR